MDKKGMKSDPSEPHGSEENQERHFARDDTPPVPELQGKAKHTKEKANPIKYDGKMNTTFSDDQ